MMEQYFASIKGFINDITLLFKAEELSVLLLHCPNANCEICNIHLSGINIL